MKENILKMIQPLQGLFFWEELIGIFSQEALASFSYIYATTPLTLMLQLLIKLDVYYQNQVFRMFVLQSNYFTEVARI